MKRLMMAALIAAQFPAPIGAATLEPTSATGPRIGAFAGARLRISLNGKPQDRVRAGLTLAPTVHDFRRDGSTRLRIGDGIAFGLAGDSQPQVSLAGIPVRQIAQRGQGPEGDRRNISTVGWVAIGLGVVAVGVFTLFELCRDGSVCGSDRDD